ncbi:MAG: transglutaminase domain-containing protein [Anaerolineae bacterium]
MGSPWGTVIMTSMAVDVDRNRHYEVGDWVFYILLFSLAICLPLVVDHIGWVPNASQLVPVSIIATLAGVLLALSPLPGLVNWIVGTGWGLVISIQTAGKILPPLDVILPDLRQAVDMLFKLVFRYQLPGILPFQHTFALLNERLWFLITKVGVWYTVVTTGGASKETITLFLGMALLIWLLTFFACSELLRQRRAFIATIPLGLAIVLNVAYTGVGLSYVYVYLGLTLITQVWANARHLELGWQNKKTDYSPEIKRDLVITGTGITAAIVFISLVVPYFTLNKVVLFFWDNVGSNLKPLYQNWDRAFAGRNPVPTPVPKPGGARPGHVVAVEATQPGQEVVLIVTTSDPPPSRLEERGINPEAYYVQEVNKHYWRQITYDTYTGSGWENGTKADTVDVSANESWTEQIYPSRLLTQTITIMRGSPVLAFAVNEPTTVNKDFQVTVRPNGDLESLGVVTDTYTVVSKVPAASVDELKAASTVYPDWVAERYLKLPAIPQRVIDLANQIVQDAGAVTPYDKAKAIETYLRSFVYDLNVQPPPVGEDVTDYFIFTLQRGYCDYSATAMTVMLRAVGVPARYASGYHMGEYNFDLHAFVVRESAAHAWTEVYFPGYNWIEFEPTPAQSIFTYSGLSEASTSSTSGQITVLRPGGTNIMPLVLAALGLILVLAFVILWPPGWKGRRVSSQKRIISIYDKVLSGSSWIGILPEGGQTPANFMWRLWREIEKRSEGADAVRRDIEFIRDAYITARYSNVEIDENDALRSEEAWRRLRSRLFKLVFSRKPASPGFSSAD